MAARLLFILTLLSIAGCGGGANILPEPFTRERADGKIPVKTDLIRLQVLNELDGMPEGEAEVARWQQIETDYNKCRLSSGKAKAAKEEVFADCMSDRGYVYMYPIDAEQLHNDIEFEMEKAHRERIAAEKKRQEEQEKDRRQRALDGALITAVRSGNSAEEARLIAQGANPKLAENEHKRIAAQKKRLEEQERARRQKELDDALVAVLNGDVIGKINKIKPLIDSGADVKATNNDGWTPLHYAALFGSTDDALAFIKAGANIRAKDNDGRTPLHVAAENASTDIALVFVRGGVNINIKDNNGITPLHLAASGESLTYEVAEGLLARLGNKASESDRDDVRRTHDKWHAKNVLALIKAGANINAKDKDGWTALHFAARGGQTETANVLIKAWSYIEEREKNGRTPLHLASYNGYTETADTLIKAGANINTKDKDGWTALHFAIYGKKMKTAFALIKAGANINAKINNGFTPLHIAAQENQTEIARTLVKAGANIFSLNNGKETPLDIAIRNHGRASKIARILREAMGQ